jgi:hypothetical protein
MLHVMVAAATAWIFIALAAALALVVTAAAARAQGRRLERRMVTELGRRWEQQQRTQPVPVKTDTTSASAGDDTAPELQVTLEELLGQRDVLLEEFQTVQAQISVLKQRVARRRPVTAVVDDDETVVQLHEVLPEEWAERRRR